MVNSEARARLDGTFRLLVREAGLDRPNRRSIELGGVLWVLNEYEQIPAPEVLKFTCISYSWGQGRVDNPFQDGQSMSDRTLPAAEAAIKSQQPSAIWIDALCVPPSDPAKTTCLRSMGAIFSSAAQVVAVLSNSCTELLDRFRTEKRINAEAFLALEDDDWVTRSWTYQEIVNSRSTLFITEAGGNAVPGNHLLNDVVTAIADYKKARELNSYQFRALYPRLDSLEGLIGDYMTSDYLKRSAYQVMSAMYQRNTERPEDYFNAMVGALISTFSGVREEPSLHPAEHYMRVCEERGDYSFIYCVAQRSGDAGKSWRPIPGPMPAVLPWHSAGDGQAGRSYSTHLQLNDMYRAAFGTVNADGRRLIDWWLQRDTADLDSAGVAVLLLERLRQGGFSGCGEHHEMESGYFFPHSMSAQAEMSVVVATGVVWTHGAPGLVVSKADPNTDRYHDVGVFVGRVPKTGSTVNLA